MEEVRLIGFIDLSGTVLYMRKSFWVKVITLFALFILGASFIVQISSSKTNKSINVSVANSLVKEESFTTFENEIRGKLVEPDLELKIEDDLLELLRKGEDEEAINFCDEIDLVVKEGNCYVRFGEALFFTDPGNLVASLPRCESIVDNEELDVYRSNTNKCAIGLISTYLGYYKKSSSYKNLTIMHMDALVDFCMKINTQIKYACVQEISFFSSRNANNNEDSIFEQCAHYEDKELAMLCQVGVGRGFMTDSMGLLKKIDVNTFSSCYSVKEVEYRARCYMVMGSLDNSTNYDELLKVCETDSFKSDSFCGYLPGAVVLGREHGEVGLAIERCNEVKGKDIVNCKLGVLIAFLNINNVKERAMDGTFFFHRQRIAVEDTSFQFKKIKTVALILGSNKESIPTLLNSMGSINIECKGFLDICKRAVGVVAKRYNYALEEVVKFCNEESCKKGFLDGL